MTETLRLHLSNLPLSSAAGMTKKFEFNWHIPVPEPLIQGCLFDRWTEEKDSTELETGCMFKVDEYGFFIYWKSEGHDGDVIELCQVSDIRAGGVPNKDAKLLYNLQQKHGDSLEAKSLTICSGTDYININYQHVVCPDTETAKVTPYVVGQTTSTLTINMLFCPDIETAKVTPYVVEQTTSTLTINMLFVPTLRQPSQGNTICDGADNININYQHVVCPDTETAKVTPYVVGQTTSTLTINMLFVPTLRQPRSTILLPLPTLLHHLELSVVLSFSLDPPFFPPCPHSLFVVVSACCTVDVAGRFAQDHPQQQDEQRLRLDQPDEAKPELMTRRVLNPDSTQGKADSINIDQFILFLNEKQRDPRLNEILYPLYDEKRATEIIVTYEQDENARNEKKLTKDGLIRYLMSDENAPVFLDRLDFYMDMDQPMAHYYINSSHNTYLSGRQFGGRSSVEMYRQVLLAGCRCVELDCWDGRGDDEEPIITHGKAMCTDILFKDVIYALRDTAFVTSDYPVVLSFENHCCKAQQYKMAKYCNDILGDLLLKEPLPDSQLEPGVPLPSPNSLKRKILIKNKRLKPDVEKRELELFLQGQFIIEDEEKEDASAPVLAKKDVCKFVVLVVYLVLGRIPGMAETCRWVDDAPEVVDIPVVGDGVEAPVQTHHTGSTTNVHPWLSSMVNYAQPIKFQGFDEAEQKNIHHNMSSFAETAGLGYLKSQAIEFVNYNKRQMSRIYPKGTRADSSNYMPQVFWNAGCQMVSLNFQTSDLPMQLNQGKFEYNGNCGYLLKPDFMRRADRSFDPFAESPVDGVIAAQCSVQKVGTYVEVDMYGLPTDTIRKEFRTRLVPANGLNPVYNEEPFLFRKVSVTYLDARRVTASLVSNTRYHHHHQPELYQTVARFGVYDDNSRLLGQRILPLDGLQAGYRHISLRTEANFPMSLPMLFCNIELKIYVPDGFEGWSAILAINLEVFGSIPGSTTYICAPGHDKCSGVFSRVSVSDFMAALSDPRAFLSAQEKRAQQMKAMGIEETDISTKDIVGGEDGDNKKSKVGGKPNQPGASQEPKKVEDMKLDPITADSLRSEKAFLKSCRKQHKELETMRKKQQKERLAIQKQQTAAIEKFIKGKNQSTRHLELSISQSTRHLELSISSSCQPVDPPSRAVYNQLLSASRPAI
uniref:1-phosphatidylinositol 4,5-bisphosphate phosphodiesterase n=1 Tax=Timema douglasi TaxID=61478 RepID=A0A7R8VJ86_TIMDO|nr:unnamed protein product [Timema douglasi]